MLIITVFSNINNLYIQSFFLPNMPNIQSFFLPNIPNGIWSSPLSLPNLISARNVLEDCYFLIWKIRKKEIKSSNLNVLLRSKLSQLNFLLVHFIQQVFTVYSWSTSTVLGTGIVTIRLINIDNTLSLESASRYSLT